MDVKSILEPRRILQMVALVISMASLVVMCYRYRIARPCTKRILITPIVFLSHVVLYYTTVLMSQEALDLDHYLFGIEIEFHAWSTGMTVHAIVTILFLTYAYLRQHKLKEELEQWNTLHKSQLF